MWRLVWAVALAGAASAAPVPRELRKQDDRSRLIGTWSLAVANVDGKDDPNYFWHSVTFSADGTSCFRYKQLPDEPYERFAVDDAAAPKTVAWSKGGADAFKPRPFVFRAGRLVMSTGRALEPGAGVIVFEYTRAESK